MNWKKCVFQLFAICLFVSNVSFATPPYMWYATHSVENYAGNGCPCEWQLINGQWVWVCSNLGTCHEDADGFNNALNAADITCNNEYYRYNRRDAGPTAARWTGTSAEINYVDFLLYAGHGHGFGPFLGCNADYSIDCRNDIRFHGNGFLKWVQAAACLWFCHPDYASGVGEFARWSGSFQGVHTVQGHRAVTYDHDRSDEMSYNFWNGWENVGESIDEAWKSAQIEEVYRNGARPGLQPATMAANSTYGAETYTSAGDEAAPNGASWFSWSTVGTPQYE